MKKVIVVIIGLPGSGKTTLADILAARMGAARVNADYVRDNINVDLGFSNPERQEHARRMAKIAELSLTGKNTVSVVDFVCPTIETRSQFEIAVSKNVSVFKVWMNTILTGRFEDTNRLWQDPCIGRGGPGFVDYEVTGYQGPEGFERHSKEIERMLNEVVYGGERRQYYLRYNTKSDKTTDESESKLKWRLFDAETALERKVEVFSMKGVDVSPVETFEVVDGRQVPKWNVQITGVACWKTNTSVEFY